MPQEYHSEQDWTTVKWTKEPAKLSKVAAARAGVLETVKRVPSENASARKIEKIADQDEEGKMVIKTTPKEVGQAVIKARCAMKLNQKELATKSQVLESDIKLLEVGQLKHNPQTLQKLQRVLKVKLLGSDIGSPIGSPI
jgi:putative transcription factor